MKEKTIPLSFEDIFNKRSDDINPSLERIQKVWTLLNLYESAEVILVAGTNGKGGTAGSLWALASATGMNVGLYTSPHVCRFSERIQTSKRALKDEDILPYFHKLTGLLGEEILASLSFFEITTALAFLVFKDLKVDLIIAEVGLGGRWDATNVTEPLASIISGIDFDHEALLGSTLTAIAKEKLAIGRKGLPLFWGEIDPSKNQQLASTLAEAQASIGFIPFYAGRNFGFVDQDHFFIDLGVRKVFAYPDFLNQRPKSLRQNFILAFAAFYHFLEKKGIPLPAMNLPMPISFLGRYQKLHWQSGTLVLDVCHNVQSVQNFVRSYKDLAQGNKKVPAFISILGDKKVMPMIDILREVFHPIIFFAVPNNRNLDIEQLKKQTPPIPYEKDFATAWASIKEKSQAVVCGSFLAVNEAIRFFNAYPENNLIGDALQAKRKWRINTSNVKKQAEFQRFFGGGAAFTNYEILEIDDPNPYLVMRHKVSQIEEDFVIVDDTSLDIEQASVGTNIKHLLRELDQHIGKRAVFRVLLGYREKNRVKIFAGEIHGTIVASRGDLAFGFNSMFLPDTASKTLGEEVPDKFNARALAVENLLKDQDGQIFELLQTWEGKFQES